MRVCGLGEWQLESTVFRWMTGVWGLGSRSRFRFGIGGSGLGLGLGIGVRHKSMRMGK